LSSSNVLCFIAIVATVSFEQINQCVSHFMGPSKFALQHFKKQPFFFSSASCRSLAY